MGRSSCGCLERLNISVTRMKRSEQTEHLVSVVHHHSSVCSSTPWSLRAELFYDPKSQSSISKIYGQFIIDVPI